jgi:hypothetical protein
LEHSSVEKIAVWAHANRDPNKQEVGFIVTWNSSELWTLIKYSKWKIKTYSGWCPSQGLSIGTTLMQIQSGQTVPSKAWCYYPTHLTFIIFNIRSSNTITHSFIPHHLPRPVFSYLHCFSAQQEKLPHGVPTENRTRACLPACACKPPSYAAPFCWHVTVKISDHVIRLCRWCAKALPLKS